MRYVKPSTVIDLRTHGRVILAEGEVTGHCHEVQAVDPDVDIPAADFFEEPDGRRVLLVTRPCVLTHQEHGRIALDPDRPVQVRQGEVLLHPLTPGVWAVQQQREYQPEAVRMVAD